MSILPNMKTILIGGTHANDSDPWFQPTSSFAEAARKGGVNISEGRDGEGFIWSTALEIWRFKKNMGTDAWQAAAHSLNSYIDAYCDGKANVIAHSHGGNVAAIAASNHWGERINHLITVGTPVRKSMNYYYRGAALGVKFWTHIYSNSDWWQMFGTFGTFNPWKTRIMEHAHTNRLIAGKGHTELHDPALWTKLNMWGMV